MEGTLEPPLDELDHRLLGLLVQEPTAAYAALGARLEVGERTVARRYRALTSRRLVRVVGRTLPDFDGQVAWMVRAKTFPGRTDAIGRAVAGHSRSRFVRATRDQGELVYGLISPDEHSDRVLQQVPEVRGVRATTAHELLEIWSARGGASRTPAAPLDDTDHRLLGLLEQDGRTTNRSLARRIRLDETTVARRRRRLEETGVLYYETDLAPQARGNRVEAMLWLDVPPGRIRRVGDTLHALPECQFVAATSGPATLVATVGVSTTPELVTLVDTRLAGLADRAEVLVMGTVYKRAPGGQPLE